MATQARQNRIFENSVDFQLKALGQEMGSKRGRLPRKLEELTCIILIPKLQYLHVF